MSEHILATVEFAGETQPKLLDLTADDGWRLRGFVKGQFERLIDSIANAEQFGPAAGDPVYRAAEEAARTVGGKIIFVRTPEPVPIDADF